MTARQVLWDEALDRHGFVRRADVAALGISETTVDHLVARGALRRAAQGIYRFPQFPASEYDPHTLAVLWTGAEEACLSHDSALAAYAVCDINPDRIHVAVAARRRIRRAGGDGYVVHYEDLRPEQVGWWQQIPTVTLPTAIAQCIGSGVPTYLLVQALERAAKTGALVAGDRAHLAAQLSRRDDS